MRTRVVVLAGGAIENARLLLVSDVGNRHDLVGRYLTDHLRGPVGVFPAAAHAALQRVFGDRRIAGGARATPGFALAPGLQQREQLMNCALWLFPTVAADDPFTVVARGRRHPAAAAAALARHAPMLAGGAMRMGVARRAPVRRLAALELHAIVEQQPDPDSRVTLASRRDTLGVALTRIDWRIGEPEMRTVRRAAALVRDALAEAGLPAPALLPLVTEQEAPFNLPDVAHPMGTTRMSVKPEDGVVDPDCAVHGLPDLFVAGSSVFPTGGHANPTQTIVALAVRVADAVRVRLSVGEPVGS